MKSTTGRIYLSWRGSFLSLSYRNMTDTPRRRSNGSDGGERDEENEVFFGEITRKERRQAVKYSRRRTVLYIPGFRNDKSLMRYSQEFTPDGPLIYAHEECVTSDVCVTETTSSVCKDNLNKKAEPKNLFPPLSDYSPLEEVSKKLFPSLPEASTSSPKSGSKMSVPCTVTRGEGFENEHISFESKSVETSSRLLSDSGVGDSVLSSSKLSECTSSRIESGITIREKDSKPVLPNLNEDIEPVDDMVFVRPQSRIAFAHSTQTASTCKSAVHSVTQRSDAVNPALTNYAGSFLSDSDSSDIDGFKRPFRLQGVFNGSQTCQTNMSTPRVASSVPSLSFASPHLLVSPIASYKSDSGKHESDSSSTKSSDSTPTKLVLSSVSAFSRFPATTAIRRSLRKKSDEVNESIDQPAPRLEHESSAIKKDCCIGTSDNDIRVNLCQKREKMASPDCGDSSDQNLMMTPPKKPAMVSTATQSDYLSLPSTLAGQQLLLVKSSELAKGQLESSPESLVSQSSWADLKLSALGINRERLCLATVSSDSSSFKTQSGESTNFTSSSDAQKPDLVTDSDKLLKRSEVTEEEVFESLEKKIEKEVSSCSPSTEFELGMNSEYFSINENETSAPDLCTAHRCENYVPSDQTHSQTEEEEDDSEDSDLDMDPSELDTVLPEPRHEHTLIENDYSPVKGRGYEREQRQQRLRPGLVWPNRYMTDSESSETEDLCDQSCDSGSSDSSLLDCDPPEDVDPLSPPSMESMCVSLNAGKLQPWRPPGYVEAPAKKSSEVKGTKKGSSFRIKGSSSNKENQLGRKYPKSPLPKNESKAEKDKKKTPCRRKKKMDMVSQTETEIDNMTKLHTLCNGQRVVRYLNFSESPMIIKHYPAPKNPGKLVWNEEIANSDLTHHSPIRSPTRVKPKPILTHRPSNHTYPYSDDVPSPIILTRTRRTNTLSHRVTQL